MIASMLPPLDEGSSQIHMPRPLNGIDGCGASAAVLVGGAVAVVGTPARPPPGAEPATAELAPSSKTVAASDPAPSVWIAASAHTSRITRCTDRQRFAPIRGRR